MTPRIKDLQELKTLIRGELECQRIVLDYWLQRGNDIEERRVRGKIRALNWVLDQIGGSP